MVEKNRPRPEGKKKKTNHPSIAMIVDHMHIVEHVPFLAFFQTLRRLIQPTGAVEAFLILGDDAASWKSEKQLSSRNRLEFLNYQNLRGEWNFTSLSLSNFDSC